MKKSFYKILFFLCCNAIVVFALIFFILWRDNKTTPPLQDKTESVLYSTPKNTKADLLFMGSSNGRMFSRRGCHSLMENILNKRVINISKTGAGIIPERLFMEWFFKENNSTKKIIYVINPFIFYTKKWNEDLYFLDDEPLNLNFIPTLLSSSINPDVKYNYIKSKFSDDWNTYHSSRVPKINFHVNKIDPTLVSMRINAINPDGFSELEFNRYARKLEDLIAYSSKKTKEIIFIKTPTLLGQIPGQKKMNDLLNYLKKKHGIKYYDLSQTTETLSHFHNLDHLNPQGIKYILKHYIKNITEDNKNKQTACDYVLKGVNNLILNNDSLADVLFIKSINNDSNYAIAHYYHGRCLLEKSSYSEAKAEFIKALEIQKDFIEANRYLSITEKYIIKKKYFLELKKTISEKSSDVNPLLKRGIEKYNIGDYQSSLNDINRVICIDSTNIEALLLKSDALIKLSKHSKAMISLKKVATISPQNTICYFKTGNIQVFYNNFESALNFYNIAINLDPSFSEAFHNRGIIHYYKKNKRLACNDWQKSYSLGNLSAKEKIIKHCNN